jgi:hypothetical protein
VNQWTLGQVRPLLTQVAGETGMSLTDARFIERINLAQQEILNLGDYPGTVDRWHLLFDEITGELVLPYYLDRLYQVTVDRVPAQIMSPWAEFVNYGVGPRDDTVFADSAPGFVPYRTWYSDCLDRGEVVTRVPIPAADGPWKLRVYATVDEDVDGEPPVINLQGYYNNRLIRSQDDEGAWYNGENVAIDIGESFVETDSNFDRLTAVVKPSTHGYVRLTAWNGTTEVELADYAPAQTTCSFRNYFIQSLYRPTQGVCNRVVLARARRRYVPVAEDDDVLCIGNIPALQSMIVSQWKRFSGDLEGSEVHMAIVKRILGEEATAYNGKARTPAISFTRGFSIGAVPFVR